MPFFKKKKPTKGERTSETISFSATPAFIKEFEGKRAQMHMGKSEFFRHIFRFFVHATKHGHQYFSFLRDQEAVKNFKKKS